MAGFHEPLRHDRTRSGGGCLMYISEVLTFKHHLELQSKKYEPAPYSGQESLLAAYDHYYLQHFL